MSELPPGDITDEMRQAVDTAHRQGLQKGLRTLAAHIRADAEDRYDGAEPGWRGRRRMDAAVPGRPSGRVAAVVEAAADAGAG